MDMNLEVKSYSKRQISDRIDGAADEKKDDEVGVGKEDGKLFETCLDKLVRSSRIFQRQYYKTLSEQSEAEEKVKQRQRSYSSATEEMTLKYQRLEKELKMLKVIHCERLYEIV